MTRDEVEQRQEHLRVYGPEFVQNLTDDQLAYELCYAKTGWWVEDLKREAGRRGWPPTPHPPGSN